MKRETVGKISSDLLQKDPETRDPIELERAMQKNYLDEVFKCIEDNKKWFDSDFYVVVVTKAERLMPNVVRNYFFTRESCPTPDYDQTVFRYRLKEEVCDYLWTIPSKDTCYHLRDNALEVHESERELLNFVMNFLDGTLFLLAKKLNGEKVDSPLLET